MSKSGKHQINLAEELKEVLSEYSAELLVNKEKALNNASDYFKEKLEEASPVDTGELKRHWISQKKYNGVKYIGNSTVGGNNQYGYGIPLTNLLEFSSKGHPFIRQTFEEEKENIVKIVKENLENGNTK